MQKFTIITDSGCDLGLDMLRKMELRYARLGLSDPELEKRVYTDEDGIHVFYDAMRSGAAPKTSATTPEQWKEKALPDLESGMDVLLMPFSSGLSTTYQSAVIAAKELQEQFPTRKIVASDTLCVSLGLGLLLYYVAELKNQGATIDEATAYIESHKMQVCHWFTVESLTYLRRGGRISATTALAGSVLGIKPIMHVDDEGHLVNVEKKRGRKASLEALVDKLVETAIHPEEQMIFISHGDCLEDARQLEQMIRSRTPIRGCYINPVGAVIGAHSGPGTMALFFYGTQR